MTAAAVTADIPAQDRGGASATNNNKLARVTADGPPATTTSPQPPCSPPDGLRLSDNCTVLLMSLNRFFTQDGNIHKIIPVINCSSDISLRLLDWFVTNYAKKHNVIIARQVGSDTKYFNVYVSYREQLKAYSKHHFDPFRRRDRLDYYYDKDKFVQTTIGQLNFFRWVLINGVLEYISEHAAAIEDDMLRSKGKRTPGNTAAQRDSGDENGDSGAAADPEGDRDRDRVHGYGRGRHHARAGTAHEKSPSAASSHVSASAYHTDSSEEEGDDGSGSSAGEEDDAWKRSRPTQRRNKRLRQVRRVEDGRRSRLSALPASPVSAGVGAEGIGNHNNGVAPVRFREPSNIVNHVPGEHIVRFD